MTRWLKSSCFRARQPLLKFFGGLHREVPLHLIMIGAAELRTAKLKLPRPRGLHPNRRRHARNRVLINAQIREVKAMNNVLGFKLKANPFTDWNVEIVLHFNFTVRTVVFEMP